MELFIIIFKDKELGCFTQPQFTDVEPDKAAKQLHRSLLSSAREGKTENYLKYKTLDMYTLGTFDDETGKVDMKTPVLLLKCEESINAGLEIAEKLKVEAKKDVEGVN